MKTATRNTGLEVKNTPAKERVKYSVRCGMTVVIPSFTPVCGSVAAAH